MIIRHGEKPDGNHYGVTRGGKQSRESLRVRGWQRAGALIHLFAGSGSTAGKLYTPAHIFAASPNAPGADPHEKSCREEETSRPLAGKLGVELNLDFGKGLEAEVAHAAQLCTLPVLITWEHENIPKLAKLLPCPDKIPDHWPDHRYDIVFVFELQGGQYRFRQVPQLVLTGDSSAPIA